MLRSVSTGALHHPSSMSSAPLTVSYEGNTHGKSSEGMASMLPTATTSSIPISPGPLPGIQSMPMSNDESSRSWSIQTRKVMCWICGDWRRLLIFPVFMWIVFFAAFNQLVPFHNRPPIDTQVLPRVEQFLLGGFGFLHWFLEPFSNIFLDIATGIPYTIHFILPFLALVFLYLRDRRKILRFVFVFGIMNLFGVVIQVLYPTSPPWYLERFGLSTASYMMKGDPSRLRNVDHLFGMSFYKNTYESSTIVFGSFPSLHAAWPFLIAIFPVNPGRWMMVYAMWVWFSAVYLVHHYLIDVLGGAFLALFFNWLGGIIFDSYDSVDPSPRRNVE